ncbi:profilin, required for normal timing of actin polymerization in response to thermal stress [Arthrobotrys musiformis]|uniref:Profilin n=1 Tax=Arthrobotrys musiformis TaxID=47236 RepID=A0AAV9W4D1_9PEZI
MSWQAYIDTSLVGTGNIDKAVILSAAGDSVWAVSPGFEVKPEEVKAIVANLGRSGNDSPFFQTGIHIGGAKHINVTHDEDHVYARQGKAGLVIIKTAQALIIAHHPETGDRFKAVDTTKALADYLKGVGY